MFGKWGKSFIFAPRKRAKIFEKLEKQVQKNKIEIYFKKACRIKKNSYFCTR